MGRAANQSLPRSGKDGFHSVPLLFEDIGDGVESVLAKAGLAAMQQTSPVAHTLEANDSGVTCQEWQRGWRWALFRRVGKGSSFGVAREWMEVGKNGGVLGCPRFTSGVAGANGVLGVMSTERDRGKQRCHSSSRWARSFACVLLTGFVAGLNVSLNNFLKNRLMGDCFSTLRGSSPKRSPRPVSYMV